MPLPRALGRFNDRFTNRVSLRVAGALPGFGIVEHRGRRTGTPYRTPVNVFARQGGFEVALTYGEGDWVRNVLAAGEADLVTRRRRHRVVRPLLVDDPGHLGFPPPVRIVLDLIGADRVLIVDDAGG